MTDRELLELAAKAAGIGIEWSGFHDSYCTTGRCFNDRWNPLTDDGDALRLALNVGINIFMGMAEPHGQHKVGRVWAMESEVKADKLSATRRAIVQAAAEIGKAMP